jgi:Flavin containing amine oxidoreductase
VDSNDLPRRWRVSVGRTAVLLELSGTVWVGILTDRLWQAGALERIDGEDFRDWLARHGCQEQARQSVFVKCWYDAVIAYENGDPRRPRISAAVALYAMFRAFFTYKGSFAYQMGHEIGDAWVGPVVQALIERGVTFHFFHRMWDLVPGIDETGRKVVESIVVERQLPDTTGHDLFTTLAGTGRKVWPCRPTFAGEARLDLARRETDDFYGHDSGDRVALTRGVDFDDVVCTVPLDALPHQAPSCYRAQRSWQLMHDHIESVESLSLRLWFAWPLARLGWPYLEPILSGADWPFSTWEDNSQNLGYEDFPPDDRPAAIATVFGSLRAPAKSPAPGPAGRRWALRQQAHAVRHVRRYMRGDVAMLWPRLLAPDGSMRYEAFYRPTSPSSSEASIAGRSRLRWQLVRANTGPLERYVLALPGTLRHRLRPHETGYDNLVFAGDWTRNGLEVGCAEGAVMSGLQAARALCGHPTVIVGEQDMALGMFRA